MKNPIIYVIANKGLHMSAGKLAAQVGHAIGMAMVKANSDDSYSWKTATHKTIIVLEGRDEKHLYSAQKYLTQRGIETQMIIDEGANEIDPITETALVSDIIDKDNDLEVIKAFSIFKLYRDTIDVSFRFER